MNKLKRVIAFLILMISGTIAVMAQPPGGGGEDPDAIPIDGGVSVLIAVGAAYGLKKGYDLNKIKSREIE